MAQFVERIAIEWYEVQAGRVHVRKGHPSHLRLNALKKLYDEEKLPAITSFCTTKDRCIHFKLTLPQLLRPAVRAIVDP